MRIQAVRVEGGFLSGLNVKFTEGLNVIIGPRGTGKTSLLELIRFGLSLPAFGEGFGQRSSEQALAVLGDGVVEIDLLDKVGVRTVTRSSDQGPIASKPGRNLRALVLAQTELERIGVEPASLLRLLDGFRRQAGEDESILSARATAKSLTVEAASLREEMREVRDHLAGSEHLKRELLEFKKQHAAAGGNSVRLKKAQAVVDLLTQQLQAVSVREQYAERSHAQFSKQYQFLSKVSLESLGVSAWPKQGGDAPASVVLMRAEAAQARKAVGAAVESLKRAMDAVEQLRKSSESERKNLDNKARTARAELESLVVGIGDIARRIQAAESRMAQLMALQPALEDLERRYAATLAKRSELIKHMESSATRRFKDRLEAVVRLNARIGPNVKIELSAGGLDAEYRAAVKSMLRGSGLRYNSLADEIARHVKPVDLVQFAESLNAEKLAAQADISLDRARRLVAELSTQDLGELFDVDVGDYVRVHIRDGTTFKPTDAVSVGQRCTAVLPLLLADEESTLILDQPEDHLDNSFVVGTVVKALRERASGAQSIIATHNANIPVLGEASSVLVLGSDGSRGFARHRGVLDDKQIVEYINTLLEGGREAFEQRAAFYGKGSVR